MKKLPIVAAAIIISSSVLGFAPNNAYAKYACNEMAYHLEYEAYSKYENNIEKDTTLSNQDKNLLTRNTEMLKNILEDLSKKQDKNERISAIKYLILNLESGVSSSNKVEKEFAEKAKQVFEDLLEKELNCEEYFKISIKIDNEEVQASEFKNIRYEDFLNHLSTTVESKVAEGLNHDSSDFENGNIAILNFSTPKKSEEKSEEEAEEKTEEATEVGTLAESAIEASKIQAPNTGIKNDSILAPIMGIFSALSLATISFIRKK